MTGTHQSMFFLNLPLQLNTSMSAVFMSSSEWPNTAKERAMAVLFVAILIPVMLSLQATFRSMQGYAGGRRQWPQLMMVKAMELLLT